MTGPSAKHDGGTWVLATWGRISKDHRLCTHLVLNESGKGKIVEQVREVPPDIRVAVLPQALVVEAIHLRDLPRFVVSAQDRHAVAIAQFESNEKRDSLNRVVSSVDIITHEEVVRVG